MGYGYTDEQDDWLREHITSDRTYREIAADFNSLFGANKTSACICSKAKTFGLRGQKGSRNGRYTDEQAQWLKNNAEGRTCKELTEAFNDRFGASRNINSIFSAMRRISPGLLLERQHAYTPEEIGWLEEHISGCAYADLTKQFNEHFGTQMSNCAIQSFMLKRGWRKGPTDISPRARQARFQPGHKMANTLPIGSESVQIDRRSGREAVFIKTSDTPRAWRLKHHVIWEAAYGPIPEGYKVCFRDGNPLNCELENLHLVNFKLFGTFAWYGLKLGSPTPEIAEAKEQFAEFISAKAALERNEHEKRKALRDKKQEVCENG